MSRKRDDGAAPPVWGETMVFRREAARLVDADDGAITARAAELGIDERRLRAFVDDARRAGRRA